ncbi:protein phosphatase [Kitasatospora sp. NPDC086791]|uniref:protein-tyrosine phosphatase family protein n=1 Tax=Kitasatospora sp. NPDC086791 TaxID=3155178 RepID=UPI003437F42D
MTDPTHPTDPTDPTDPTSSTTPPDPTAPPTTAWPPDIPGLLRLPSGRLLRGRGLSLPPPPGPRPTFGLYLLGRPPKGIAWEHRWVRWPDFRLPGDRADAADAFREAWQRAAAERVELACAGGRGRTGTALACIAVLDGVPAAEAVAYVREHYSRHAVETPWQRKFVERLA